MTNETVARGGRGWGVALAGATLGVGIASAAWIGADALRETRAPDRVVTVKGLAERRVEADVAIWRLPFRGQGATREAATIGAKAARDAALALGRGAGLSAEEMSVEPFALSVERSYVAIGGGRQEERVRFSAAGAVRMRSTDPAKIDAVVGRTSDLLDAGVLLGENDYAAAPRPTYVFTRLNEVKPEMIAEATRNARLSASQFAEDSGSHVGRIVDARQGVVQILAAEGDYDERTERRKLVRVVSTIRYQLVD